MLMNLMLAKEEAMGGVPEPQLSHLLNLYVALKSYNLVSISFIIQVISWNSILQ